MPSLGSPDSSSMPASVTRLQKGYVPLGAAALPQSSTGGSLSQLDPWKRSVESKAGYMLSEVPLPRAEVPLTRKPWPYAPTPSTILSAGTPAAIQPSMPEVADPWLLRASQAEASGALGPAVGAQRPKMS